MNSTNSQPDSGTRSKGLIKEEPVRPWFLTFFGRWEWLLVAMIAGAIVLNASLSPYFLNATNLARTSKNSIEMGLMMLPEVFIIITGDIDLSVESTLGMSASLMGWLHLMGVNFWVAALAGMILGTLGGLLNGILVARVKIPSLVVTLGTYAFYRGLAYGFLGTQVATNYPDAFNFLGQGQILTPLFPFQDGLFILMAIIFGIVLHKTTFGRYLYAIGNNKSASIFSGVPVARIRMINFTVTGFLSALAGMVLAARFGSTQPDIGSGLLLPVITAAVLGGVDINGGSGSMVGAVLSLILIGLLNFGMGLLNIQGQVQGVVIGSLLIVSILLPVMARSVFSGGTKTKLSIRTIFLTIGIIAIFALFIYFFFWSRAPVLGTL